jgi:hypothetical protein
MKALQAKNGLGAACDFRRLSAAGESVAKRIRASSGSASTRNATTKEGHRLSGCLPYPTCRTSGRFRSLFIVIGLTRRVSSFSAETGTVTVRMPSAQVAATSLNGLRAGTPGPSGKGEGPRIDPLPDHRVGTVARLPDGSRSSMNWDL